MKLYKYRTWKNEKHRLWLTDRILWFSSPATFNDPFDCNIPLRYDLCSNDEFALNLIDMGKSRFSSDKLAEFVSDGMKSHPWSRSKIEQIRSIYTNQIAKSFGILSFARVLDNILLWSHYADCHRGFCIEYDRDVLDAQFNRRNAEGQCNNIIAGHEIAYPIDCPILVPTATAWPQHVLTILTTKSSKWSYESEYRYLWAKYINRALYAVPDAVTGVYLGCECREWKTIASAAQVSFPGAPIFQSRRKFDAFGLDFEPLSR